MERLLHRRGNLIIPPPIVTAKNPVRDGERGVLVKNQSATHQKRGSLFRSFLGGNLGFGFLGATGRGRATGLAFARGFTSLHGACAREGGHDRREDQSFHDVDVLVHAEGLDPRACSGDGISTVDLLILFRIGFVRCFV
jgi:hypothetical protein